MGGGWHAICGNLKGTRVRPYHVPPVKCASVHCLNDVIIPFDLGRSVVENLLVSENTLYSSALLQRDVLA